jgi:hypothetical protein
MKITGTLKELLVLGNYETILTLYNSISVILEADNTLSNVKLVGIIPGHIRNECRSLNFINIYNKNKPITLTKMHNLGKNGNVEFYYNGILLGNASGDVPTPPPSPSPSSPKVVAYLNNWDRFPSKTTDTEADNYYKLLFKNSTHIIVSFVQNHDISNAGSGINCLFFDIPYQNQLRFTSHTDFITYAKTINPDIKLLISFGGQSMGCCPLSRLPDTDPSTHSRNAPPRNFFKQFINSGMADEDQKRVIDNLYNLIVDPDKTLATMRSHDKCTGDWPPREPIPSPSSFHITGNLTLKPSSISSSSVNYVIGQESASYDGIDIDYEFDYNVDENHPVSLITEGLALKFKSDTSKLLTHAPFNSLFDTSANLYYKTLQTFANEGKIDFINIQYYDNPPFPQNICYTNTVIANYNNAVQCVGSDKIVILFATTGNCETAGGYWTINGSWTDPEITISQVICNMDDKKQFAGLGYWNASQSTPETFKFSKVLKDTSGVDCTSNTSKCITPDHPQKCTIHTIQAGESCQAILNDCPLGYSGDDCIVFQSHYTAGGAKDGTWIPCGSDNTPSNRWIQVGDETCLCPKGTTTTQALSYCPLPPKCKPMPTPAPPSTKHGKHKVVSGDTCYGIAQSECSDGANYNAVICNPNICNKLSIGQIVKYDCARKKTNCQ